MTGIAIRVTLVADAISARVFMETRWDGGTAVRLLDTLFLIRPRVAARLGFGR